MDSISQKRRVLGRQVIGMNTSQRMIRLTEMTIGFGNMKTISDVVNTVSSGIAMMESQLKTKEKVR